MNQLLIVNSTKALTAKKDSAGAYATPFDLSNLAEGAITFFELGASSVLSAAPTKNFAIALGKAGNNRAIVIPEVDIDTLEITKALPAAGAKFSASFTMPTTVVGKEYGIILVKKGVVTHERNLFSTSIVAKTTTASTEATAFRKAINDKANELFNVTASGTSTTVTITANDDADYEIKFVDELAGTTTTSLTHAKSPIGDKKYVEQLAQKCAGNKGFTLLDQESRDIYPGYPEAVEDLVPNSSGQDGASTAGYALFSLHFATGRKSGKQVDERVWQYVYIAVPVTNSSFSTIEGILPEGKFSANAMSNAASAAVTAAAASAGSGSGSGNGG